MSWAVFEKTWRIPARGCDGSRALALPPHPRISVIRCRRKNDVGLAEVSSSFQNTECPVFQGIRCFFVVERLRTFHGPARCSGSGGRGKRRHIAPIPGIQTTLDRLDSHLAEFVRMVCVKGTKTVNCSVFKFRAPSDSPVAGQTSESVILRLVRSESAEGTDACVCGQFNKFF
jgi:hypothetical protein